MILRPMILLIDNYDSFTYNLLHLIGGGGHEVLVLRNDVITVAEALDLAPASIVLSPGPCTPDKAGICLDLVLAAAKDGVPLFGVCLGMQTIAQAFGGRIVRAKVLKHGKTSRILHHGAGVFKDLPNAFVATRYHSLIAEPQSLPSDFVASAHSEDDHEIMAIEHKSAPIAGVQFHPESIASEYGAALIKNFFNKSGVMA